MMTNLRAGTSILIPGVLVILSLCFGVSSLSGKDFQAFVSEAQQWIANQANWPLLLGLLYIAYLVGNVFRALPVNWSDHILCGWWAWLLLRARWDEKLFEKKFPYIPAQSLVVDYLEGNGYISGYTVASQGAHSVFNFMEMRLCVEAKDAYDTTRPLAERTRLFHGMIFGSVVGIVVSSVIVAFTLAELVDRSWLVPVIVMGASCLLLYFVFGLRIRRVRGEEVTIVLTAYLARFHASTSPPANKSRTGRRDERQPSRDQ